MKKFAGYFLTILFLSLAFGFLLWRYANIDEKGADSSISPLPEFLTLSKNNQVRLLDLWLPVFANASDKKTDLGELSAKSILVYDLSNDKTIYERAPSERLPMASLAKIMTAVIALENKKEDDKYIVRAESLVGENSMGLTPGEELSLDDLLHGLLLVSGNDAAETLASNHRTGRDGFIKDMNQKAASLGLSNTKFNNPSGLEDGYEQYTTAYDLLVITRYALENHPEFKKIVATSEHVIPLNSNHSGYHLYNETNLLTTYEGVRGVKTGYTASAGLCLVTYLENGDHKIVAILLNSTNRREEMRALLDYALKSYNITPPEYKG
jgi:serine-type D-Ala-D-Ala carboxypeptidase (penicillin-binding protein 5/6)